MSTFAEFIVKCENRIENRNTRTTPYLQEATVRWLKELSNVKVMLMEDTCEFLTVAGQNDYGPGTTGFPLDAITFQTVYVAGDPTTAGSALTMIAGPAPIERVRALRGMGADTYAAGYPVLWAWHHNTMLFAPQIAAVLTIQADYTKDATRDTATGDAITTTSTTHTNPWFDRGEHVLIAAVLWDYYSAIGKDMEAAALSRALYEEGLTSLRRDYQGKAVVSGVSDWVWGDY